MAVFNCSLNATPSIELNSLVETEVKEIQYLLSKDSFLDCHF
jgi:hypothetical protein